MIIINNDYNNNTYKSQHVNVNLNLLRQKCEISMISLKFVPTKLTGV